MYHGLKKNSIILFLYLFVLKQFFLKEIHFMYNYAIELLPRSQIIEKMYE